MFYNTPSSPEKTTEKKNKLDLQELSDLIDKECWKHGLYPAVPPPELVLAKAVRELTEAIKDSDKPRPLPTIEFPWPERDDGGSK